MYEKVRIKLCIKFLVTFKAELLIKKDTQKSKTTNFTNGEL